MGRKKFLIIISGIFILLAGGLFVFYNIIAARFVYGSLPVVSAPEEVFNIEISDMPEEILFVTAEEFMAMYDILEDLSEEELRLFIERVFNLDTRVIPVRSAELVADEIFKRPMISDRIINIMILGDDARIHQDRSNSDTMMLVSINRDTREILLTSFMRDMFVPTSLSGDRWFRINTIYAEGGPGRTLNVVNHLFSLDIQRYVILRFASVFELVDILGGLDLELRADEAEVVNRIFPDFEPLSEGLNHMNGRQVLAYVRMRQWDGRGDFGRTARQRYVLRTVIDRVLESRSFSDIAAMANYAINHIETNITLDEVISLALDFYFGEKPTVRELRLPEIETYVHAIYYDAFILVIDFEKNITALHEFVYGCAEGVNILNFTSSVMDSIVYDPTGEIGTEIGEDEAEENDAVFLALEPDEYEADDNQEEIADFEESDKLVFETDDDQEEINDSLPVVKL